MTENVVKPGLLLQQAKAGGLTKRLSEIIQAQGTPAATPYAKMRLGYVMTFDPATWTVTAVIGDLLTTIPNIPVLGGVLPAIEAPGMFMQTGGDRTTEYTLIGTLPKDPGTPTYGQMWRLRTTADQTITNSGPGMGADAYLKFYGQAGRTYLFETLMIVAQNTNNAAASMDFILGWILPSGATWSGGGPGPISSIATGSATESTGAGNNWRAFASAVGGVLYGVELSSALGVYDRPDVIMMHGSIKMGSTSGLCSVGWAQAVPATASTRVKEGSYLKVDMTSEYTL